MKANRILFITQEVNPYVPESNITGLGKNVPLRAVSEGKEVRAFMPKWGNINERRNQLHEVIRLSGVNLTIDKVDHPLIVKVASVVGTRMQLYFVDSEDLFAMQPQDCRPSTEYRHNIERMVFYARSVIETMIKLRWIPDVIHCQGWVSCLAPLFLKVAYADEPTFRNCRVVYTSCDEALMYAFSESLEDVIEFRSVKKSALRELSEELTPKRLEMLGIKYADGVSFHSPTPDAELVRYAKEMGKPVMEGEVFDPAKYVEFFDHIWGMGKSEPPAKYH